MLASQLPAGSSPLMNVFKSCLDHVIAIVQLQSASVSELAINKWRISFHSREREWLLFFSLFKLLRCRSSGCSDRNIWNISADLAAESPFCWI